MCTPRRPLQGFFLLFCLTLLCCQYACKNDAPAAVSGDDEITPPADALFQKVPSSESNIRFANVFKEDFYNNIIRNPNFYNGGGAGIIDVNNDGKPDIFLTSTTGACKLYLNEGGLKFRDITKMAGVAAEKGFKSGVTIADVNGDGWQDIYLCRTGPFMDDGDIRGIYIFNVSTLEEARALTETDPAVQAGRLAMELHTWFGSAALPLLTPLHRRLEKKNVAD